jgi:hypothetical protein
VKSLSKNIVLLLALSLIVSFSGYILLTSMKLFALIPDLIILTVVFSFIAVLAIFVFQRGQSREPQSQTMHTLVSMSLKFLLELLLTIIWFIVAKKTFVGSVLMFFILYLAFSLFLIMIILKTLKNKSL